MESWVGVAHIRYSHILEYILDRQLNGISGRTLQVIEGTFVGLFIYLAKLNLRLFFQFLFSGKS